MEDDNNVEGIDYRMKEQVKCLCPCRSVQIEQLIDLFGEKGEPSCPCIFVYGHTGTGKNHVLKVIMNLFKLKHVIINCIECYSAKLIFETILESFEDEQDDLPLWKKCDNFNDFIRYLKPLLSRCNYNDETFHLIFKQAERLRNMESNLLAGFIKLAELMKMNISVILVTEITIEKFLSGTMAVVPTSVHFNEYNQKDLVKIMSLDCPAGYNEAFYATYCQLVISVFYLACRDLNELRHMAIINFPKYCEPLEDNKNSDVRKLWRNIEPKLKKCLSTVYMREVTTGKDEIENENVSMSGKLKLALELPFLSKYLLIAAYLASNNPTRTDRRFFCKHSFGKMSKRTKTSIKNYASDGKLTGPKAFPLDRLMAIFFSIVDDDLDPNASLLSQISSLVYLNLLAKVSADDQIDSAKYKCLANADFIKSIADNLDFQLEQYLFNL